MPVWLGSNEEVKHKTAKLLQEGGVFAFGLSEKEHGADIYSSDMMLYPQGGGTYKANGDKYYIGNGNEAALVSTFAKMADTGEYVFFAVNSKHPNYECVRNVVNEQNYVAEFALHDYPITDADIMEKGPKAWDDMLNTINICKFNLGWGAIGLCTHAFYEAIDHAANRNVYGKFVTDFPHVKRLFTDAYCRLVAMKLFCRAGQRLHAVRQRRTTAVSPLQSHGEDEGHPRRRRRDEHPPRCDRSQGIRKRALLRNRQARTPHASQAGGDGAREHGPHREIHGQLLLQSEGVSRGAAERRSANDAFLFRAGAHRGSG